MHEHIYTEIKACKINKQKTCKPNKTQLSDKKKSLVHKVPSGVAILSHMYGVAVKTSTLKILSYLSIWQIWGDKEFLSFMSGKIRMGVAT